METNTKVPHQRDYRENPLRFRNLKIAYQGSMGVISSSARSPRQHHLLERAPSQCFSTRVSIPTLTASRQTPVMDSSPQQVLSVLRPTSILHRSLGQREISNSAHHVSFTHPIRYTRAIPPALLPHSSGEYRPQVLTQHHRQSSLQWSANLSPRTIDSTDYGHIRQLGIRQHTRSTATSDSRIRRFLGILGTTRHHRPQGVEAVKKGLEQNVDQIQDKRIRLFQDNTVVVSCLSKFSS